MQNIYFSCKDVLYLQRPILDPCLLIQRAQKFSLGFSRSYINLDRDRTSRSLLTKRFLKKKPLAFGSLGLKIAFESGTATIKALLTNSQVA